jgi:glycosyltransferase involved in cell wall biosynthesis
MRNKKVSVVTTIYRGKEVVTPLIERIETSLIGVNHYEIILVDDNCPEKSWSIIKQQAKNNTNVKGVKLSRNFGQQIAMSAGMRFATGDMIILLDGDLQNPPENIPTILAKLDEGFDLVYTTSKTRNNWKDEITSKLFWFFIKDVLKIDMIKNQLMMKGLSKRILDHYNSYDEHIRIVAGIVYDIGLNSTSIEIVNERRTSGKSNYNFMKRLNLMIDIVLTLSTKPLSYLINLSLISFFLTAIVGGWNIFSHFLYPDDQPPGYMTLLLALCFFGSATLFVLGIIGKYLSNIYQEVRRRPLFIVEETSNLAQYE